MKKLEAQLPATQSTEPPSSGRASGLDAATLSAGLKDALRVGAERAVAQLSATDGFLANPKVHIPLPATIAQASTLLDRFGLGALAEQLEVRMNPAAEQAAPAAATHLKNALEGMTIDDARRIFEGPTDAATRYFEAKSADRIGNDFRPIIQDAMDQVGVSRYYQQLVAAAKRYPLVGSLNLDLQQHATQAAVDGLFSTLGGCPRMATVARARLIERDFSVV